MWGWVHHPPPNVHRRSARRIVLALHEARQRNEVRHRLSIFHGSTMRGKPERPVTRSRDLYKPHGDGDNQGKRRLLKNMSAEQREAIRAYDRERRRKR
jgi:hypothetical protein